MRGLLPALRDLGVTSSLVTGTHGALASDLSAEGFRAHTLDLMSHRLNLQRALELRSTVLKLAPQAVHAHGTRAAFYVTLAGLAGRVPCFYTAHGLSFRGGQKPLRRWAMASVEWLSCARLAGIASVSESDLQTLRGLPGLSRVPGQYIQNPVDAEQFKPGDSARARERLGISSDAFVVGTVGRLVEQKALHVLIEAMARVENAELWIVGEGPLRGALENQAKAGGVSCRFLGERHDVAAILPAFDLFALASAWEGEPLSLLEAMACGIPCVATDTPGSRAILQNGKAGALVPLADPAAMAAMINLWRADATLYGKKSELAKGVVATRTMAEVARLTLDLYQRGLGT